MRNSYFVERIAAYLIDIFIVTMIASLIAIPFTNTKNYEKLSDEASKITENYQKGNIDTKTYMNQYLDINYDISKAIGVSTILSIIVYVLYFIVFQFYNNGQTLGKKFMKIKIVSMGNDLTMDNMLFRSLFNNSILSNILVSVFILIGKNAYIYGSIIVTFLQFCYVMICALMISFRKDSRSLSDFIGNTKVVSLRSDK